MFEKITRLVLVNFKLCFIEVFSNKTRSFLTCFGIFLGVASLLGMMSFVRGFQNSTKEQLERMGGLQIMTISSRQSETQAEQLEFSRSPGLRLEQMYRAKEIMPEITAIIPSGDGPRELIRANNKSCWGSNKGVFPEHLEVYNYKIDFGRPFEKDDFTFGRRVVVIGPRIATTLFGNDTASAINKTVHVGHLNFTIIGIVHAQSRRDWRSRSFMYPYKIFEDQFAGHGSRLNSIDIKVSDISKLENVQQKLTQFLYSEHRGIMDFEVELNTEKLEDQEKSNKVMAILLGVIASISLVVGGISIANIMFGSIGERIREIGIRKSLGARKTDLFLQFFTEAVLLCSIGGMLGMLLGTTPVFLPEGTLPFKPELLPFDYILGFGASVLVGILSGIFPAFYAANMKPIEALAYT